MGETTKIFISATTSDLGSARQAIKEAFFTMGVLPIEQTNFPPDARSIKEVLESKIRDSDAVVHLVGFLYGSEPKVREDDEPRRSYTQWEYEIARSLEKPVYVFIAENDYPFDEEVAEDEGKSRLQREHRERILAGAESYSRIESREELEKRIRELRHELEKLRSQVAAWRKRIRVWMAIGGALILGIGGITVYNLVSGSERMVEIDELKGKMNEIAELIITRSREAPQDSLSNGTAENPSAVRTRIALERIAASYGKSVEDFQARLNAWTVKVRSNPDAPPYDRAMAAYLAGDFAAASGLLESSVAQLLESGTPDRGQLMKQLLLLADCYEAVNRWDMVVKTLEQAHDLADRQADEQEWARVELLAGRALSHYASQIEPVTGKKLLLQSSEMIRNAATYYTKERSPYNWAVSQSQLMRVYGLLANYSEGGSAASLLDSAIQAAGRALEVYQRDRYPIEWARLQHNLGLLFRNRAKFANVEQASEFLRQSIDCYESALEVRTPSAFAEDWANTLTDLGTVRTVHATSLPEKERIIETRRGIDEVRRALEARDKKSAPREWARSQAAFGSLLNSLGANLEGPEGEKYLGESVEAAEKALPIFQEAGQAMNWADTKFFQAMALQTIGQRKATTAEGRPFLLQAEQACRDMLVILDRESSPGRWAKSNWFLGRVLSSLAITEGDRAERLKTLARAEAAIRASLEVYTRESNPTGWGWSQLQLGIALEQKALDFPRDEAINYLDEASMALGQAREVLGASMRDTIEAKLSEIESERLKRMSE